MMRVITIHLPEPIISLVDKLVHLRLHPNRNAAIRFIIQDAIQKHVKLISSIIDMDQDENNTPGKIAVDDNGEKFLSVNFRMPIALYALMKADMDKRGIRNRSEYIRQAILTYAMSNMREE